MKTLVGFWGRYFLLCEFAVVVVITAALVYWVERGGGLAALDGFLADRRGTLYGAVAGILGSLLGFAITAETIVLGFSTHERLDIVRNSQHYLTLWRVFIGTIRWLGIATVAALCGLFLDRDAEPVRAALYICVFASAMATVRLLRCVWVLEKVVLLVATPPTKQDKA